MSRLFIVEQSALAVGGHYYAYTQSVARAARRAGLDVTILQNRRFSADWGVEGASVIPTFRYTWGESEGLWIEAWEPGNVAYDYHAAVADAPPGAGDHVLFATIGYAELRALLNYFISTPLGVELPVFHVLLRYDPEVLRQNLSVYGPLFARIAKSSQLSRQICFHTDTDQLSEAFSWLTQLPFTTLPIPFQQERLKEHLAVRGPPAEPLVVTYLGDARLEKNFAKIPAAVAYLWKDYVSQRRVRFVLQCNFNSEGGEPGILEAVQKLAQYSSSAVELLSEPLPIDAYYERLAAADIVLVPYDPERYRARSSGILVEAMAAGKPLVTTERSWMATQVAPSHAVLLAAGDGLGPALKQLLDNFTDYKRGADQISDRWMDWSSGDNFIRSLLSVAHARNRPVATTPALHVLYIMDGDALVLRNGAGLLGLTQLRYLKDAGYSVTGLFIMNKPDLQTAQIEHWADQLKDRIAEFEFDGAFLVGTGRLSMNVVRQRALRGADRFTIAGDLERVGAFDVSLELVAHIAARKYDAVWLNYVFNAPLIDMLGLTDVPAICETVDIQSFQKAIYGRRRVDPNDLKLELQLLSRFRSLISVSSDETAYLRDHFPDAAITTVGIFPPSPSPAADSLAGSKSLGEVISSCLPALAEFQWETSWRTGATTELIRLIELKSLDLVYVSSNHLANVSGLRWFLDEVYLPYLAPAGVSMIVAGSIREAAGWPQHETLFFVGRLDKLEPLYAAARLVVLPVMEGAGAAVKTAEALSMGRPIVGTPTAFRGMDGELEGVDVVQTPQEFVVSIRRLLASETERESRGRATRRTAARLIDPCRYADLLNGAFQKILGDRARLVVRQPDSETDLSVYLEWGTLVERLNRLVRGWLDNEPFEEFSLAQIAEFPQSTVADVLKSVLDALLVKRSAPVLQANNPLLNIVAGCDAEAAATAYGVIVAAIDMHRPAGTLTAPQSEVPVVFNSVLPLEVFRLGSVRSGALQSAVRYAGEHLTAQRAGEKDWVLVQLPRTFGAPARDSVAWIEAVSERSGAFVRQALPLSESVELRGEPIVAIPPVMQAGAGGNLRIPNIFSPYASRHWLDFVLDEGASLELDIKIDGLVNVPQRLRQGTRRVLRCMLPRFIGSASLSKLRVEFLCTGGSGGLADIVQYLVFGDGPMSLLGFAESSEPGVPRSNGALTAVGNKPTVLAQTEVALAGLGASRSRARVLRDRIAGKSKSSRTRDLVRQGDAGRDAHDWAMARRAYGEALKHDPGLAHIWVQYGHALKESGLFSEALGAYSTANLLKPGAADTLHQLARMQDRLGQFEAALANYDKALAFEPLREDAMREARDLRLRLGSASR